MLSKLHLSHMGMDRMKSMARSYIWWPNMSRDIEVFVRQCENCMAHRNDPPKTTLNSWEYPVKPWSRLHIDFMGPFYNKYFLIILRSEKDKCWRTPGEHFIPIIYQRHSNNFNHANSNLCWWYLFALDKTEQIAANSLQTSLNDVSNWCRRWTIKLNQEKSVHINFTNIGLPVFLNSKEIPKVSWHDVGFKAQMVWTRKKELKKWNQH